MGANFDNALIGLVMALFDIYLSVLLARVLLQYVRADFYNPISQVIWRFTRPLSDPIGRILPKVRRVDVATLAIAYVLALVEVQVILAMYSFHVAFLATLPQALFKLIELVLRLYWFTMFVQALMSWIGPGVNNPASSVLWSLNEPLLRPVRRLLPPVRGLDLSMIPVLLAITFLLRLLPLHPYLQ